MAKRGRARGQVSSSPGESQEAQNPKYIRFAHALWLGRTQAEAAKEAGFQGSKKESLEQVGCRVEKLPEVQAELARLREQLRKETVATQQEVLEGLTRIWRSGRILDDTGRLDLDKIAEADKAGILEQFVESETIGESTTTTRRRVQLRSRLGAADRIIRVMGWAAPKKHEVEHTTPVQGMNRQEKGERLLELTAKVLGEAKTGELLELTANRLGLSVQEFRRIKALATKGRKAKGTKR